MTDITSSFLQQVSAGTKKYEGIAWNDPQQLNHKSRILKSPPKRLPFVATASEISKNIIGLQNFLKEHKTAYLDTSSKYLSSSNFMTDDQKDEIDKETMFTIDKCKGGISSLQHSLMEYRKRRTVEGDVMAHLVGIVDILQHQLMDTASMFKTFKKDRVKKKMQEAEGYFKLDAIKRNPLSPLRRGTSFGSVSPEIVIKPKTPNPNDKNKEKDASSNGLRNRSNSNSTSPNTSPLTGRRNRSNSTNNNLAQGNRARSNSSEDSKGLPPLSALSPAQSPMPSPITSTTPAAPIPPSNTLLLNRSNSWLANHKTNSKDNFNSSAELLPEETTRGRDEDDEDVLLESERELLEAENASLQREFDTMTDQVRVIERQLVEVSSQFDELIEHVSVQKETMENISDLTEGAIGHTREGVKNLKDALHHGVDFRVMVLLFIITCSLSLLFLHWYED